MKVLFRLVLAFSFLLSSTAFGRCFPEDHSIHPMSTAATGISQADFNAQLDLLVKVYGPEVEAKGFHLVINRLWSDETINSDTDVEGQNWVINSYGGLARYPGMTPEGYLNVACHELGHHMGGAPIFSGGAWPGGGAAVEGEADYWADLICMKRLAPQHAQESMQVLANTLASLGGEPVPDVNTPDKSVVKKTYEDHPAAQCRLDTYFAALNCSVSSGEMSNSNPKLNSCYSYPTKKTSGFGSRPRCWFAPSKKADGSQDTDPNDDDVP